jgi:hypothetical protein
VPNPDSFSSSMLNSPAFGSLNGTQEVGKSIYKIKQKTKAVWPMQQVDEHLYAEADAMVTEAASAAMKCAVSNQNVIIFIIMGRN